MSGTLELGYDYTNNITRAVRVDATGKLEVVSSGGGGGGDATAANQVLQLAQETIIAGDTTSLDTKITACDTGAVVVSSSALPTGAATEATLSTVDGKITACDTGAVVVSSSALPTGAATEATLSTVDGKITACDTGAVVVSSSALPTGASTSALQTTGNASLATIAGDTTSVDSKITFCNTNATVVSSSALPTGAATEATLSTVDSKITICNTGAVVVSSSALPTGASTSAAQTTANTTLATIANDTTSLDSKITNGADATLVSAQQVAVFGRDSSGNLDALKVDNLGHLQVVQDAEQLVSTIFSGTQTIAIGASHTFATTLDKNGSSVFNLLITSTTSALDIDYSIRIDASDDNTTFYDDANSAFGPGPSATGIQNAQLGLNSFTPRYARFTFTNNSPSSSLVITSVKATRINGI
jgi:hypothetical protein